MLASSRDEERNLHPRHVFIKKESNTTPRNTQMCVTHGDSFGGNYLKLGPPAKYYWQHINRVAEGRCREFNSFLLKTCSQEQPTDSFFFFFLTIIIFKRSSTPETYIFTTGTEMSHPTDGEKKEEKNSQVKITEEKLFKSLCKSRTNTGIKYLWAVIQSRPTSLLSTILSPFYSLAKIHCMSQVQHDQIFA